ncbi:helix-turn-helix domain-containing protein [Streptomyces sp. Cmuel-A718b]|uniref:helix-turn-helix domain-containing protein n=1 Tax=Streptomyces sp. Cmuel-A718b TaxID=697328 RepID=UPI001EFB19E9|nr:helix-turn-helix domain-containing protein [Streptomyces sp. Cmuel-A718b]
MDIPLEDDHIEPPALTTVKGLPIDGTALIITASTSGTPVTAIARLVTAHEDTVRDVINAFNERGLAALGLGGREAVPLISDDEREFIITTARTRSVGLGQPFTHWSLRKLTDYLARNRIRTVRIGRERLRQTCANTGSPSSARAPGRSPKIPTRTPRSTALST